MNSQLCEWLKRMKMTYDTFCHLNRSSVETVQKLERARDLSLFIVWMTPNGDNGTYFHCFIHFTSFSSYISFTPMQCIHNRRKISHLWVYFITRYSHTHGYSWANKRNVRRKIHFALFLYNWTISILIWLRLQHNTIRCSHIVIHTNVILMFHSEFVHFAQKTGADGVCSLRSHIKCDKLHKWPFKYNIERFK